MTEKEALEIFKNLILLPSNWLITDKYEGTLDFIRSLEGNEAIQTILNLIEKLQTENEQLQTENEQLRTEMNSLQKELKQKDKIIDLMAEDIDGFQMECNRYFKDKEEVKQYFENKAKEIR